MIDKLKIFLGTGFYSGYLPKAPGTFGSLVALGIYLIPGFENLNIIIPILVLTIIISIYLGSYFEIKFGKDPSIFVLDEFIGTWITYLFLPKNIVIVTLGFIIWRVLDIYKPFPAKNVEELKGGLGINLDDIISGMYSLIIMHIFNVLFY